ncbi:MAG: hypothetical protein JNG88_15550 [Phycisphaerales bacterium]|nr:hypothetical protein [Phycisphaerales bacterium]
MDLARDQAAQMRDSSKGVDAREVEALLIASVRLDPGLADAYALLYEYDTLVGNDASATARLEALTAADPRHVGAFGRLLDRKLAGLQTVEKRIAWLESLLAMPDQTAARRALILERLAVLSLQRMDHAKARDYADRALSADPLLPEAALLAFHTQPADTALPDRLHAGLSALRLNCTNAELCWQVGMLLFDTGLTAEAEPFLSRGINLHKSASGPNAAPTASLISLALAQWAGDHGDAAIGSLREAADRRDDPQAIESNMLLCWMLRESKRLGEAEVIKHKLADRFAQVRDPAAAPIAEIAQAAWFHCTLDVLPQRALALASAASERANTDEFVRRVLGWAQWRNSNTSDALQTLSALVGHDPFAAYAVAKIHADAGDVAAAARVLESLTPAPRNGPAQALLAEIRDQVGSASTQPTSAAHDALLSILGGFDAAILTYESDLPRSLDVTVDLEEKNLNPAQPWRANFTLVNRAKYPITLGEDGMVNPAFLLSFKIDGDRPREWPHLQTVTLDRRRALAPGEKLQLQRTLDVGPLRRLSRMSPQQLLRIQLDAIFDPAQTAEGGWTPGPTGRRLNTLYFNRLPANVSREGMNATFASVAGPGGERQFDAIELLAQLLSESQRAGLGQLKYAPEAIPADRALHAIRAALTSESWELRVRALEALQIAGLDAQTLRLVAACAKHENWLVRLFAVRLIARGGADAREQLLTLTGIETDELVRTVIRCRIEQIDQAAAAKTPTTNPAP